MHPPASTARSTLAALSVTSFVALCLGLAGCGDSTMRLESDMTAKLEGEVATTVRLEGPVRMELQGPIVKYEGTYVSEELFERIEPGTTRRDWLLAVLGEPTSRATLDDGTEIWAWTYRPVEQQGSFVQLFGGTQEEPQLQPSSTFVHLDADGVVEAWRG